MSTELDKQAQMGTLGNQIVEWWRNLPEEQRNTALRGLVGAGGGALLMRLLGGRNRDADARGGVLSPALMGALLGGGAAVAAPMGYKMLTGDTRFGKPPRRGPIEYTSDKVVGGALTNPFLAAGGAGGLVYGAKNLPSQRNILKGLSKGVADSTVTAKEMADAKKVLSKYTPFKGTGTAFSNVKRPKSFRGLKALGKQTGSAFRNLGEETYKHLFDPQMAGRSSRQISNIRDLAKLRHPGLILGGAALGPALGYLADQYTFGR